MEGGGDDVEAGVYYSEQFGRVWMIALQGDFDLDGLGVVQEVTEQVLSAFRGPVVFDLALVSFCDSALLNHLVRTAARRPTALVQASTAVARLLELTGAGAVFASYEDLIAPTSEPEP
ncbi:STAS domain-containing protein [Streptomyces sp. NRRL F-5123]|uniref:STAS domain-containing protein n=1 Tax=Streptomyces sp. NRRL F-5123 TaxID=1463856 RepID=UPI0004E0EC0F|nr:STAS domain-containing protein [Streptomyces sp. NRRL F-5123]